METLQVVEWVAITTVGIAVYIVGYGTFYQWSGRSGGYSQLGKVVAGLFWPIIGVFFFVINVGRYLYFLLKATQQSIPWELFKRLSTPIMFLFHQGVAIGNFLADRDN